MHVHFVPATDRDIKRQRFLLPPPQMVVLTIWQLKMCLRTWYTDENGSHTLYLRPYLLKKWQETINVLLNSLLLTLCLGCAFLRGYTLSENHLLSVSVSLSHSVSVTLSIFSSTLPSADFSTAFTLFTRNWSDNLTETVMVRFQKIIQHVEEKQSPELKHL